MRSVELVRRAHQQIAADRTDVHQRVRRVVDRIDEAEGAGVAREPGGGGHVGDRPEDIRRRADGQELRPRREGALERVPVQLAGRGVHRHGADRQAPIAGDRPPRIDVAVMIQLGDDYLVARLPLARQGPAQVERQRRHVRAEGHLLGRRVEKISQRTARGGDGCVRLLTRGIGPVRVGVVMEEVVSHAVGDDGRDLGAAWSVEVRHGMAAVLPVERGKLIADDVYWRDVRHSGSNRLSQRRKSSHRVWEPPRIVAASLSRFYGTAVGIGTPTRRVRVPARLSRSPASGTSGFCQSRSSEIRP